MVLPNLNGSAFLPIEEDNGKSDRRLKESKVAVSYVANELLEKAMKFSDLTSNFKIKFWRLLSRKSH